MRVPRLTKLYHDQIRQGNMPEFKSLDGIFENHFKLLAEEMGGEDEALKHLSEAEGSLLRRAMSVSNEDPSEPPKQDALDSLNFSKRNPEDVKTPFSLNRGKLNDYRTNLRTQALNERSKI